jgi:chromate transporter
MNKPSLQQLTTAVALDVNRTLGGGYPAMELMRRRFAAQRWLDAREHGLFVAISRVTPGTNVLAYCVGLGWQFHGWRGALLALAAGSIPSSVIVYALAITLAEIDRYAIVRTLLAVGMLVACALVFSSAWILIRPFLESSRARAALIAAVSAALMAFGATPVRVLLVAAAVSAILPVTRHQ